MPRSTVICDAMALGIMRCGGQVKKVREEFYNGPETDVAVFYGLRGRCRQAFIDYRQQGRKAVYIDLGYWKRVEGGKLSGYHKVAVNSRHPTAYFRNRLHPGNRFAQMGLTIKPWRTNGKHILVAGMGAKAADVEGFKSSEWETDAVAKIKQHTDRPIIYRPKPSWRNPEPIDGTIFSHHTQKLAEVLEDCHAIVSHHSNVCIDGLIEGIPVFCAKGVASVMGSNDIALIETPHYPDDREQFCNDVAYTQWRPSEMETGQTWRYLRDEGIV